MNKILLNELKDRRNYTDLTSNISQSKGTNTKKRISCSTTKVKKRKERFFERGAFPGIINQGSTCFLNSLLHMLNAIPEFRNALYLWKRDLKKDGEDDFCAGYQMQRFFASLEHSKRGALSTRALTGSFGWNMSRIGQQDCQECMAAILDFFITQYDGTILSDHAKRWQGRDVGYIKCLESGVVRPCGKEQPFWALRLLIEDCTNIKDAFSKLLRPEVMKGENAIMNEALGRKTDSEKGMILSQLPEFLTIQLQRFTFCMKTFRQIKLNNIVEFPFELDLNDIMSKSSVVTSEMGMYFKNEEAAAKKNKNNENYVYDLHAVVIHLGGVTSGHYFAYTLHEEENEEKEKGKRKWYIFNDASVREMSDTDVKRAFRKVKEDENEDQKNVKSEEKKTLREALNAAKEGLEKSETKKAEGGGEETLKSKKKKKKKKGSRRNVIVNAYKYAYVLLYRRRSTILKREEEEKNRKNKIPSNILDEIRKDNEKYEEAKKKWEIERNTIRFRVHRSDSTTIENVKMLNSRDVNTLKDEILKKCKIEKNKKTRLRIYDHLKNLRRRPLRDDEILHHFFERDNIAHIYIEIRDEDESFEEWFENGFIVKVYRLLDDRDEYDTSIQQCMLPRNGK